MNMIQEMHPTRNNRIVAWQNIARCGSWPTSKVLRDSAYHSVITAVVTYIQLSFIGTLTMLITQTLDSTVSRRPTKVTDADLGPYASPLVTSLGADWYTCTKRKRKMPCKVSSKCQASPPTKPQCQSPLSWLLTPISKYEFSKLISIHFLKELVGRIW